MLSEAQAAAKDAKMQLNAEQAENSSLREQLTTTAKDLEERTEQLLLFQRSIGVLPQGASTSDDWNTFRRQTLQNVDLAKRLEDATIALQVMEEAKLAVERRLQQSSNWRDDYDQPSRSQWRTMDEVTRTRSRESSPLRGLPSRLRDRPGSVSSFHSLASRSETDSIASDELAPKKHTQNLRNEIEELTARLELSELQRRRLESRGSTHSRENSADSDIIELRRLQRENARLHELVDEQAEKLSVSEGFRSKTPVNSVPPQQMVETIKSLEQSKKKLTDQQNMTLRELTKCRQELDKVLASSQNYDKQIKSLKQQLEAEQLARQTEQKTYQQSTSELRSLKIRMETSSGRCGELEDAIKMHKMRSENMQNKLEDAEITAHNAMRSELFAKEQLQEVEEALSAALKEQRKAEDTIVSLQKELHILEGKVFVFIF